MKYNTCRLSSKSSESWNLEAGGPENRPSRPFKYLEGNGWSNRPAPRAAQVRQKRPVSSGSKAQELFSLGEEEAETSLAMAKFALRQQKGKSSEGMPMQGWGWFCLHVNKGAGVPTLCVAVEEFHPGSGAHPIPTHKTRKNGALQCSSAWVSFFILNTAPTPVDHLSFD